MWYYKNSSWVAASTSISDRERDRDRDRERKTERQRETETDRDIERQWYLSCGTIRIPLGLLPVPLFFMLLGSGTS